MGRRRAPVTDKILVFTNCGTAEEAHRIAQTVVRSRLAACVNVMPAVQSTYQWQGAVEQAEEWTLMIKSKRSLFDKLRHQLRQIHSYQVPEIIAVPIVDGDPDYLEWMDRETSSGEPLHIDAEA
jgi:periplasmic divalent cation tolerance protein